MKNAKAFTLVELLVVISIIAMLLAVLMPALSKAREQGRMVVCRTNEKTLTMAATLWSGDNDGWAIAADWYKPYGDNGIESSLEKYSNCSYKSNRTTTANGNRPHTSMVCPSAVNVKFFVHDPPDYTMDNKIYSYASNGWISLNLGKKGPGRTPVTGRDSGGWSGPKDRYWTEHGFNKMMEIRRPNETAFFIDNQYYVTTSWTFDPTVNLDKDLPSSKVTMPCRTRWHTSRKDAYGYGVGNISWVDGHVSVEPSEFSKVVNTSTSERKWEYYFYNH